MQLYGSKTIRAFLLTASIIGGLSLAYAQQAQRGATSYPLIVGGVAHLSSARASEIDSTFVWASGAGLKMMRWDTNWRSVETALGVLAIPADPPWDYAVDHGKSLGVESLLILDYGNPLYLGGAKPTIANGLIPAFVNYAKFVVSHFYPRVKNFEIWNEWDNGSGGGTAQSYVDLVAAVYPAIKAIAPDAKILVGGSSRNGYGGLLPEGTDHGAGNHFFEHTIDAGLLKYATDGLSIHTYCRWEATVPLKEQAFHKLIAAIDAYVRGKHNGRSVPLYITEIGWPTSTTPPILSVSQSDQAALMRGTIIMAAEQYSSLIRMYLIYDTIDNFFRPAEAPYCYGLIDGNNVKKLSYNAVKDLIAKLGL